MRHRQAFHRRRYKHVASVCDQPECTRISGRGIARPCRSSEMGLVRTRMAGHSVVPVEVGVFRAGKREVLPTF